MEGNPSEAKRERRGSFSLSSWGLLQILCNDLGGIIPTFIVQLSYLLLSHRL